MTSQAGKQTIKVHILPNIFQNSDNEVWSAIRIQHEKKFS